MLFHFLHPWLQEHFGANLFRYITFRSFCAFLLATLLLVLTGGAFIRLMKRQQFGQIVRNDGPASHFKKAGTPTMGGLLIIGVLLISTFVCGNFYSLPFLAVLMVMLSYFLLGLMDDYLKVLKKNTKGVSMWGKLIWQFGTALLAVAWLLHYGALDTKIYIPFLKGPLVILDTWSYLLFTSLVIVGTSNAVNLTDGLDGLAIGPIITSAFTLGILAYVAGHREISAYLFIPYVENAGELIVLGAALVGAGVGFLWYNSYPAQIFMGDVGSLSMGGALGMIAVSTKNEFLFGLIGGIFVIEALSVILQVGSYKLRKKRIFKMAPIHHHFELQGWPEPKVIVRFWIVSICLAILSLATLKTR